MNIIKGLPNQAHKGQRAAVDTEFFNQIEGRLHRPHGDFAAMTIAMDGDDSVYLVQDQRDIPKALDLLDKGTWVMSNAVYDLTQLRRFADIQPRYIWDTELVERCTFGGLYDNFSLKDQARRWLDMHMEKEVREEFYTAREMTPQMEEYAARDALVTLEISKKQDEKFTGTRALDAYNLIDEPAIWPTLDIQPMKVDVVQWEKNVSEYIRIAKETEDEIGVNSMSPQQVKREATKYGLHLQDTAALTLEEYKNDFPFVAGVLKARMYRKAVSTYGLSWLEKYVEEGDLVYAGYRVTGAETHRRSSQNPNMQQIPARKMPEYRDLFISKYGRMMVADVSAQEPRILAHESQDPVLIAAFITREDVHQTVANAIQKDRDTGKIVNLATSYGMTADGLARKLGISVQEAERLLTAYFMRFKGVFAWIGMQRNTARKLGYVTTVSGHPIYINPHNYQWENNAINSPIQGGAGDFSKMWERKLWEKCRSEGIPYSVCGLVHDEIIIDPPKDVYKRTKELEIEAFNDTAETLFPDVPFEQEIKSGKKWSCKKLSEEDEEEEY